jgi:hypothetical protein
MIDIEVRFPEGTRRVPAQQKVLPFRDIRGRNHPPMLDWEPVPIDGWIFCEMMGGIWTARELRYDR